MSVTSGFFNSLNGDRKYNAEQMSAIFNGIINDGVFANIGTAFGVRAAKGNEITVGIGRAWFNSAWVYNDTVLALTAEQSEVVLNRYDAVVIEINHTDSVRKGDIKIIKGTPSSSPEYPAMIDTEYVHQHPLAYIYRAAGSNEITQGNITSMIGTSVCPYITGILKVLDIDNIVAQWQGQWDDWRSQWGQWEAQWDQWFTDQSEDVDAQTAQWMSQMKSEFESWFNNLQIVLEGDVAAKLGAAIVELNERFHLLVTERAVYEEIQDSANDTLLDSDNNPIEGRTVMGGSMGSDSGSNTDDITPESIGAADKIHANQHGTNGVDPITPQMIGAAPSAHASQHKADGSDPITPELIGAAKTSHKHAWADLTGAPSSFTPSKHASTHGSGGSDPITPSSIGAVTTGTHNALANRVTTLENNKSDWVTVWPIPFSGSSPNTYRTSDWIDADGEYDSGKEIWVNLPETIDCVNYEYDYEVTVYGLNRLNDSSTSVSILGVAIYQASTTTGNFRFDKYTTTEGPDYVGQNLTEPWPFMVQYKHLKNFVISEKRGLEKGKILSGTIGISTDGSTLNGKRYTRLMVSLALNADYQTGSAKYPVQTFGVEFKYRKARKR